MQLWKSVKVVPQAVSKLWLGTSRERKVSAIFGAMFQSVAPALQSAKTLQDVAIGILVHFVAFFAQANQNMAASVEVLVGNATLWQYIAHTLFIYSAIYFYIYFSVKLIKYLRVAQLLERDRPMWLSFIVVGIPFMILLQLIGDIFGALLLSGTVTWDSLSIPFYGFFVFVVNFPVMYIKPLVVGFNSLLDWLFGIPFFGDGIEAKAPVKEVTWFQNETGGSA